MIFHKPFKQLLALTLVFTFMVSSCGTKQEVQPTPQNVDKKVDLKALSVQMASDADFKNYVLKIAEVYKGQSKFMHEQYQGDAKAYQNDVNTIYAANARTGWSETRVAQLDEKMGLAQGSLMDLVSKRQVVLTKFTVLSKLSEKEMQEVVAGSLRLMADNAGMRTNNACKEACTFDYLACVATATGVSIGLLAACAAITFPPAVAACVAVIVIGDVFVVGGCYFSLLACERRC